jgi:hypothetical protein
VDYTVHPLDYIVRVLDTLSVQIRQIGDVYLFFLLVSLHDNHGRWKSRWLELKESFGIGLGHLNASGKTSCEDVNTNSWILQAFCALFSERDGVERVTGLSADLIVR